MLYSDDVTCLLRQGKIQEALDLIAKASGKHSTRIHSGGSLLKPKTKILWVCDTTAEDRKVKYLLGQEPVAAVMETKLLGRMCSKTPERTSSQITLTVEKAKKATRMLSWLDLFSTWSSMQSLKVGFDALVTSVMVAGTTHTQLTKKDYKSLRTVQVTALRRWLRTSALCSHWCILLETGWDSTDAWINFAKLRLLEDIKRLPDSEDGHHVVRARISDVARGDCRGLVAEAKRIYSNTETPDKWNSLKPTSRDQSQIQSRKTAFREARRAAVDWVLHNPEKTGDYYFVASLHKPGKTAAWHLSNGSKRQIGLMVAARCGAWNVAAGKTASRNKSALDVICKFCAGNGAESIHHILMECQWAPLKEQRRLMMGAVARTLSDKCIGEWRNLNDTGKRRVLLGAPMHDDKSMDQRRRRDCAVKSFMEQADTMRQDRGFPGLCGHVQNPPEFSLEEALQWVREEEREQDEAW